MNNLLSDNEHTDNNKSCPCCGSAAKETETEEICDLLTNKTDLLTVCINANKLIAFQQAVAKAEETGTEDIDTEDPCMFCLHNIITEHPGTFLQMKPSATEFIEIHKCFDCGTKYEVKED